MIGNQLQRIAKHQNDTERPLWSPPQNETIIPSDPELNFLEILKA